MKSLPLYPEFPHAPASLTSPLDRDPDCSRCTLATTTPAGSRCLPAEGKPGGILIVSDYPGEQERRMGRPFVAPAGAYLRKLLGTLAPGVPVVFHSALGCKPPSGFEDFDTAVDACRPYLTSVLAEARPSRILVMGKEAGRGLLGRTFQPLSVRKGYGWVQVDGVEVPAFLLPNPAAAVRNKLVAKAFEEDLAWALTANPSPADLWDDYAVVETVRDSLLAEAALSDMPYPWAMDVEASGMQFEPDYRLECLSISASEGATFVWSREALEIPEVARQVAEMLEAHQYTSWNGQYDAVGVHCEALFTRALGRPCKLNLVSDGRLKRKLLDAAAVANLATAAELVGLGGHKEEAHTLVDAIATELKLWARSFLLTPTGKARKPPVLEFVDPAQIPHTWKDYLNEGHRPEMFAYRFLPKDILHRYNALDALATVRLEAWCEAGIDAEPDDGLRRIWEEVTGPAMEAYIAMRIHGVPCDKQALGMFRDWLVEELKTLQTKLDGWSPGFNALSNPQVVAMMQKLGVKSSRQTPGGKPSASKEVLEEFKDHEWLGKVLRFRKLDKLRGTYAEGMFGHVRSDGRVHASFLQDGTECLPAGELVLTNRGYLEVEKVAVGDLVLSHKGRQQPVVAVSTHAASPIYTVLLDNGMSLSTTGNHPYWTGTDWVTAANLKCGDTVRVHSRSEEQWREVDGFPYSISSWGRVMSNRTRRVLAQQFKDKWGHLKVTLVRNRAKQRGPDIKDFAVHRLVLTAFGGSPPPGMEVCHRNGVAWDNTIENLYWGTSRQNKLDASRHGTMSKRLGGGQFGSATKLSEAAVAVIRATPRKEVCDREMGERYGCSRELIREVRMGRRWQPETHILAEPPVQYTPAKVVAVVKGPPEVSYGLTVAEDESHVTGGIVTHNTGRSSSADPNLYNMPKPKTDEGVMLRLCFRAPPGRVLIECDESQIEIRVAADLSLDEAMIGLILSGKDFHQGTADLIGKDRDAAKTTNFAVLYEMPERLGGLVAKRLKVSKKEGTIIAESMFGQFKRLRPWMNDKRTDAEACGYARTRWKGGPGRKRPLWSLGDHSPQGEMARENAIRSTWNSEVQGTAVDIVNSKLLPVHRWLQANTRAGKILLQVYDSIMVEVDEGEADKTVRAMQSIMREHPMARVPLAVDAKVGDTWGSMKAYEVK